VIGSSTIDYASTVIVASVEQKYRDRMDVDPYTGLTSTTIARHQSQLSLRVQW
jgi:hypothetical protein